MKKRKKKSSGRINRLVFEMWNEKHKVRRKKPKKGCFFFFLSLASSPHTAAPEKDGAVGKPENVTTSGTIVLVSRHNGRPAKSAVTPSRRTT